MAPSKYILVGSNRTVYPINPDGTTIGRLGSNTIVINHQRVSKTHARIFVRGDRVWVRDEGSAEGTRINGFLVQGYQIINVGDLMQIGPIAFRLEREESPSPEKTPKQLVATGLIVAIAFFLIGFLLGRDDSVIPGIIGQPSATNTLTQTYTSVPTHTPTITPSNTPTHTPTKTLTNTTTVTPTKMQISPTPSPTGPPKRTRKPTKTPFPGPTP